MNTEDALRAAVDRVAELLDLRIGLRGEPSLRARLRRCIVDEATLLGEDVATYLETLSGPSAALQGLVDRITVQETAFFRHPEQFEILARDVLPAARQPVLIWSAACANGQEPYSLAMLLEEQGVAGRVLATDLAESAVARTAAARYAERELGGLSQVRTHRHLTRADGMWEVEPNVRERVAVFRHNLLDPIPEQVRSCQIVFCRNVLIYFSAAHAQAFLARLADTLPPGATLFVGSAETIWQVTDRFQPIRVGDSFVHRSRRESPAASARPVARAVESAPRPSRAPVRPKPRPPVADDAEQAALMARVGQDAVMTGDRQSAVIAFRKWAYLAPNDPLAHLHLGLALEAAGDQLSARRAFGTARRTLLRIDPNRIEEAIEGYTADELRRFLDFKNQDRA
ncbi:MAG TPA: CheR family methyltransferase [Amycolatopsis sp.]|nr:CheR family methyltransferase [Amycolatopsis sp.]